MLTPPLTSDRNATLGTPERCRGGACRLDSALFIYLISEHPLYLPLVEPVFLAIDHEEIPAATSALTLLETLVDMLNSAGDLRDMRSPPGNRLELLKGDLRGYYSVRINERWRLVFQWRGTEAHEVRIVDYHRG